MIWYCLKLRSRTREMEARNRELQRLRIMRQNLERLCDGRGAEISRLRTLQAEQAAEIRALEGKTSELNVSLFNESGLRILAEKEEGARRMKMEQLEKEFSALHRRLREQEIQTRNAEEMYQSIIREKDMEIAKLQAAHARRTKAKVKMATGGLDQICLDDLLTGKPQTTGKPMRND